MKKIVTILIMAARSPVRPGHPAGRPGRRLPPRRRPVRQRHHGPSTGRPRQAGAQWRARSHGRVDLTFYGQNSSTSVTDLAVAADYTYHVERRQQGLYVLAGLSQQNYHTAFPNYSRNDNGLGIDLGPGLRHGPAPGPADPLHHQQLQRPHLPSPQCGRDVYVLGERNGFEGAPPRNRHQGRYDFGELVRACTELAAYVRPNRTRTNPSISPTPARCAP